MTETTSIAKTTPKDFFLNLGAIVTLYFSVISFISLAFAIINHFLPDQLAYYYGGDADTIRWTISALLVAFPLHVWLSKLISKEIAKVPEKKHIWVKKWSVYLTLFLTSAAMAVDLIVLVNHFLAGEITSRFFLKVIVVLITTLFVFLVYLHDLKRTDYGKDTWVSIAAGSAAVVVLVAMILGFMAIGSPFKERQMRFDDQRVQDLSSIQYRIIEYWQKKGSVPATLSELNDPLSSFMVPLDPETGQSYSYQMRAVNSFEFCADFGQPSRNTDQSTVRNGWGMDESFLHESGTQCFTRTIDPALYPVNTPPSVQ